MKHARRVARFRITHSVLAEALHRQFGMPHEMSVVGFSPSRQFDGVELTVTSPDLPLVEEGVESPLLNPTIEAVSQTRFVMHFEDTESDADHR